MKQLREYSRHHLNSLITLHNVLHASGFHCNLISISRLTKEHNCVAQFFLDFCVVQDLSSRKLRNGLCYYTTYCTKSCDVKANAVLEFSVLRYQRLGHLSRDRLASIPISSYILFDKICQDQECILCPLAI